MNYGDPDEETGIDGFDEVRALLEKLEETAPGFKCSGTWELDWDFSRDEWAFGWANGRLQNVVDEVAESAGAFDALREKDPELMDELLEDPIIREWVYDMGTDPLMIFGYLLSNERDDLAARFASIAGLDDMGLI
ncbi:MAG: hypothetical protein IJI68_08705 [Eggerthellaceae bacterium]|nr:hypothetical protein [Eggerthellaceae bacterium]